MLKYRSFSWFLLLLVAGALLSGAAAAQEAFTDQPADPAALPYGGSNGDTTRESDHMNKVGDWSMLTYQKLGGQNWDIYVHDKSGARRLTTHWAVDQHPSLDRGTRRVAFTSNRSGDFDLYLVNVDGSDLKRILDNRSTIAFPAWSPDGSRIAIQAKVGSQYEIYVVNANGSSPQRLTNNAAFDGMPAWSPDGKKLAFASNRSGNYSIHVMNADGSAVRKLSSYPNSLHPTWSPNGKSIAFDADIDGDGWQELAVIDAGGTKERAVYDPGFSSTAWAGSWSPDNSTIGFTEITAELQNGNWVWTKALVRHWNPNDGADTIIAGGREWYMNWASSDDIPPSTAIDPLPAFTKVGDFTLRWSGTDAGGSGIKSYAVTYNENDGKGWQTFIGSTNKTETSFPARPGTTVDFRVLATDKAFNRGPWSMQTVERTTFYESQVSGTVSDNRGNPLTGVPVIAAPALSTDPVVSGWQGNYNAYAFKDRTYTLSIDEPYFKPTPNTKTIAGEDFVRDFYLMPKDSKIKNGTFENNSSTPSFWTTAGTLDQAVSGEEQASGRFAYRLGQSAALNGSFSTQNAGTASISQVITIPASMSGPTLSYMLRTAGEPGAGNSGLRVRIETATNNLDTVVSAASASRWSLQWIDMAPWRGKQVTVTFELLQNAGDPLQTIYLDDISLGSIKPDLWVLLASGPAVAIPGEDVSLTLDYGNRGSLLAENGIVEMALPPELELISATPPYTMENNVLRWEIGDLAPNGSSQRLLISVSPTTQEKEVLVLKTLIHADSEEAHLRNNTSETSVSVVKNIYMPLLAYK